MLLDVATPSNLLEGVFYYVTVSLEDVICKVSGVNFRLALVNHRSAVVFFLGTGVNYFYTTVIR